MGQHAAATLFALACGCAASANTCPSGTRLVGLRPPAGVAEYCAHGLALPALPISGHTYVDALGFNPATLVSGGADGPYTSWYADGALASHGRYVLRDGRSLADGVWGFWHPDGSRWAIGAYRDGQASGCFAVYDERPIPTSYVVDHGRLRPSPCTPPDDDEIARVEAGDTNLVVTPARIDLSVQGLVSPSDFGASNPDQEVPVPAQRFAATVAARAHLGPWRLGGVAGLRLSDASDTAFTAAAVVGLATTVLHPRLAAEVTAELGLQRILVTPATPGRVGSPDLAFVAPWLAGQAGLALALSPQLEATFALRAEGAPPHDATRTVVYCAIRCLPPAHETWTIGGLAYGAALGLRVLWR